jgi:hypothetical protein
MSEIFAYQFEWNAALALNNLAIKMMESACYKQANATFRDATLIVRQIASAPNAEICRDSVLHKLDRANRCRFNPVFSSVYVPINVLHYEDEGSLDNSETMKTFSLIRTEAPQEVDFYEAASIILYNYAVSWLVPNEQTTERNHQQGTSQSQETSLQILQSSLALLESLERESECAFLKKRVMSLMIVIWSVIADTLDSVGTQQDLELRAMVVFMLDHLQRQARELAASNFFMSVNAKLPSAAA